MSRYEDHDDYLDARQEAADLNRDALMDEWDDERDDECRWEDPECSFVKDEDYTGEVFWYCEMHQ